MCTQMHRSQIVQVWESNGFCAPLSDLAVACKFFGVNFGPWCGRFVDNAVLKHPHPLKPHTPAEIGEFLGWCVRVRVRVRVRDGVGVGLG